MLKNNGKYLPQAWIAGDDEMGRSSRFRRDLRALGERYLLAVPSNTSIRDLDGLRPLYGCRGQPPKRAFQHVDRWRDSLPDDAWAQVDVRNGEKGTLVLEIVKRRVVARTERSWYDPVEELRTVTRSADESGKIKHDHHLSSANPDTSLDELARLVKAAHRVEDGLKRAKSEAGLSDYEVRTWAGWYHHQTLFIIATWFLILEARLGGKNTPAITVPQVRNLLDLFLRQACDRGHPRWAIRFVERKNRRRELARFHHYKRHNLLAPLRVKERK